MEMVLHFGHGIRTGCPLQKFAKLSMNAASGHRPWTHPASKLHFLAVVMERVSEVPATGRQKSNKGVNPNRIPEL